MGFQPSPMLRMANKLVTPFIRWGLPMGVKRARMALLTVPGRKTGIERTTPIALERRDDGWLLVAVYGVCDWSQNLEAAGAARITTRGETTQVQARRLESEEAGHVLRDAILGAPAMVQRMTAQYFTANEDSPIEMWRDESVAHPVFVLTPV